MSPWCGGSGSWLENGVGNTADMVHAFMECRSQGRAGLGTGMKWLQPLALILELVCFCDPWVAFRNSNQRTMGCWVAGPRSGLHSCAQFWKVPSLPGPHFLYLNRLNHCKAWSADVRILPVFVSPTFFFLKWTRDMISRTPTHPSFPNFLPTDQEVRIHWPRVRNTQNTGPRVRKQTSLLIAIYHG